MLISVLLVIFSTLFVSRELKMSANIRNIINNVINGSIAQSQSELVLVTRYLFD